jgi:carnitine O-palmitoyltransferase 2
MPDNSYINDYWSEMYLRDRVPLPYNYNPFLQLIDDPRTQDPCVRAASLISSCMRFYKALKDSILEPDIFHMGTTAQTPWFKTAVTLLPRSITYYAAYAAKSYPLDMSQYPQLFGTTRLAMRDRDTLFTVDNSRHITVLCGGQVYSVDTLKSSGEPVEQAELEKEFRSIYLSLGQRSAGPSALTTLPRDEWANLRPEFLASNPELARSVESSIMVLALDQLPATDAASGARIFLHAAHDRWYDKSLQLIVAANGRAAINFEHSWGDGVSVLRLCNEMVEDSLAHPLTSATPRVTPATPLPQKITPTLATAISNGVKWVDSRNMSTAEVRVLGYGKNFFKNKKIAPDGCVQNAIQLAYKMAFGKTVATYESASTAGFKRGRTETIRPATIESAAFVRAMMDSNSDRGTRERTLRAAADVHRQNSTNAAIGQGMDRHLFALRKMAEETNIAKPAIFTDPSYARMNYNILSTSTLVSPFLDGGGFGPVVPDGFGVGYGTTDDAIAFVVTTYNSKADLEKFTANLDIALKAIRDVLSNEK